MHPGQRFHRGGAYTIRRVREPRMPSFPYSGMRPSVRIGRSTGSTSSSQRCSWTLRAPMMRRSENGSRRSTWCPPLLHRRPPVHHRPAPPRRVDRDAGSLGSPLRSWSGSRSLGSASPSRHLPVMDAGSRMEGTDQRSSSVGTEAPGPRTSGWSAPVPGSRGR